MTQRMPASTRGWIVTVAAVGINLILGALYAWGVIGKALVVQWHWTKTEAALPFTVSTASFALMMIFAGRWQDKMGPRLVAMVGGVMFGLALCASAYAGTPVLMLLTFGVVGGIGIGLCYSATTPPAIKWFPSAKKGLITGIVVSGVGLAAVYVSPLTQVLLERTSIPTTFMIFGIGRHAADLHLFSISHQPARRLCGRRRRRPGGRCRETAHRPARPRLERDAPGGAVLPTVADVHLGRLGRADDHRPCGHHRQGAGTVGVGVRAGGHAGDLQHHRTGGERLPVGPNRSHADDGAGLRAPGAQHVRLRLLHQPGTPGVWVGIHGPLLRYGVHPDARRHRGLLRGPKSRA